MNIGGFQKSSLIDYPKKISAIVFTQGCNFRCGYCHNPELIKIPSGSLIEESFVIDFLKTRIGKLDAVVITGGEPCLQNDLIDFVKKVKDIGFLVKLDTNGSFPEKITELIDKNLLDYIAMDIKAPVEKYEQISLCHNTDKILESIELIKNSNVEYEFRTTVVKSQLSLNDFSKIAIMLKGAKKYYLQEFVPTKLLDESFKDEKSYSKDEFNQIADILTKDIESVFIR